MSLYHSGQTVVLRSGAPVYDANGSVTSSVSQTDTATAIIWGDYITLPTGVYAYPVVRDLTWFAGFRRGAISPAPIEYVASTDVSSPAASTANAFVDTASSSSGDDATYAALIAQANAAGLGPGNPEAAGTLILFAIAVLALVLYFRQK